MVRMAGSDEKLSGVTCPTTQDSQKNKISEFSGFGNSKMAGPSHNQLPDHLLQLEGQNSKIVWSGNPSAGCWSGDYSVCCKNLKHYEAFIKNGTRIAVHSFAFIMTEAKVYYLVYLDDMYEDNEGQKMVKVRWFEWSKELSSGIITLPLPKEVIITSTVQVMGVESIVGTATVLTPRHYEYFAEESSSGVYFCSRQVKNKVVKPFTLSKLSGYSKQAIFSLQAEGEGPVTVIKERQIMFGSFEVDSVISSKLKDVVKSGLREAAKKAFEMGICAAMTKVTGGTALIGFVPGAIGFFYPNTLVSDLQDLCTLVIESGQEEEDEGWLLVKGKKK